ncbi:hypothetical protein [Accumulibacter sp.]|uniref:hypothetical protein n=1 Tax=Accumulibacter sp. TaxID=2053492 RepID=UPI0025EB682D|nr:hypothetical protein [Accumulibacter sp.]MCM8594231.1 CDP-glycerol glycerophosphotransferase family protein [Accumulibacter sp.]MCM8625797.1 CDP-glycerol glycerophosphotransferase family protein [Accumulibacter sp.]MDS4048374.1 hypothetical protein [Accumulibacter sp.]
MTLIRALEYALGPRFRKDLLSLLRHRMQPSPDVLFVAGSQVDLQWVIPAYEAAVARGLNCAFAGPDLSVPPGAAYVNMTMHVLRFARATLLVTATSGLTLARMPRSCVRRVAVPHSLVSLHMVYPPGTFDGYTDVFCCGEHHLVEIEAMNRRDGLAGRRPVLIGYGKFERLATTRPTAPTVDGGPTHVLVGPSWGPGNLLETLGEALLIRLLAEGYRVTLRPHPSFFVYGDALIARIVEGLRGFSSFVLENSVEESHALWTADMMIADYSGFAMEFAFVRERPVLYVDVPPKVLNPGWRDLGPTPLELAVRERIGVVVPPAVDEVIAGLARLGQDTAQWASRIRQERERHWVNFGGFGEACAEELAGMLATARQ